MLKNILTNTSTPYQTFITQRTLYICTYYKNVIRKVCIYVAAILGIEGTSERFDHFYVCRVPPHRYLLKNDLA